VGNEYEVARLIHSTTKKPQRRTFQLDATQVANYYRQVVANLPLQDVFAVSMFCEAGILANLHRMLDPKRQKTVWSTKGTKVSRSCWAKSFL